MAEGGPAPVRVLCFGALRERLGAETLVTERVTTVGELWSVLTRDRPDLGRARDAVRAARNLTWCDWASPVVPGDEVAFMPPVSGGSTDSGAAGARTTAGEAPAGPRVLVELVSQAIDAGGLAARTCSAADGAVASFAGVVRETSEGRPVTRLDYEAYAPMAEREMRRIGAAVAERHALSTLTLVHRVGSLAVGEVSVAVVAAAPHRGPALRACAEAIELIKRDLPIWKREHHPDGAFWVDARQLEGPGPHPPGVEPPRLSHLDASGAPRMVDVSDRPSGHREAAAEALVRFASSGALAALRGGSPKGDALAVARLAGIIAAKHTPELIPLCHPLPLTHVEVEIEVDEALPGVRIRSAARCVASTGVEMEALTAAAVAGLTVIDMLKSADPWMALEGVRLLSKSGGRSGAVRRPG